jgi:PAS domain S-box-containing protein
VGEHTDRGAVLDIALRRWFEELSDRGIFTTDSALVVTSWNRWLEAQTGVLAAAAVGRSLFELFPSLVERGHDRFYGSALRGEVQFLSERLHKYLLPISRNTVTGGLAEMAQSVRIAPLTADDAVVGTITVIEDVSERVVSERELRSQIAAAEEASKLKDDFLLTLSHELRTPLNAVMGWVTILRTQPTINSLEHGLKVIERNAASQLRLVEDLLDTARAMSGKLRLDVKPVALEDVAQAAIDVVSPAAEAKQITIHTEFDRTRPVVSADSDRLQQAIWNLMSNAVKFTPDGGRIEVRVSRIDGVVELMVRDNGEGITREFLPFAFDRFRQSDPSTNRHGGLGLGLSLVRQIAELHGGSVSAESAGPSRGSTFLVRLPASDAAERVKREPNQQLTTNN